MRRLPPGRPPLYYALGLSFGLVASLFPTPKVARHKLPWSCLVPQKSLAPAVLLAFLAALLLTASARFGPARAADGEDCAPGKPCSSGKVYNKQTLMRMSCQALEDLEESILPPEASSLDPIGVVLRRWTKLIVATSP